jgi:hypothetical protein
MANGWHRKRMDAAALARKAEYNSPHYKQARAQAKAQVEAGHANCWRCHRPIPPGTDWHLGHHDSDRTILMGPEHATCNLKAAASKGAQVANARRRAPRITALRM